MFSHERHQDIGLYAENGAHPSLFGSYLNAVLFYRYLTGKDIIEQLKDKDLGSCVWTTNRILNDEQTVTLDDMTLNQISEKLGTNFKVSNDNVDEIIEDLLYEK